MKYFKNWHSFEIIQAALFSTFLILLVRNSLIVLQVNKLPYDVASPLPLSHFAFNISLEKLGRD